MCVYNNVRKLLNLPDAVTSSSTGQPKPPSPIPFSFEQPKDQSVIGHEDPPMVNKEASGPQASRVENVYACLSFENFFLGVLKFKYIFSKFLLKMLTNYEYPTTHVS